MLFGEPPLVTTLDKSHVTLPFLDEHGQSVLIACTLIQLGEKAITPKKLDDHIIDGDSVTLTAITLWKEDWGEDWNTIAQNPIAHIKKTINDPDAIVSIWGKHSGKENNLPLAMTAHPSRCTVQSVTAKLVRFFPVQVTTPYGPRQRAKMGRSIQNGN